MRYPPSSADAAEPRDGLVAADPGLHDIVSYFDGKTDAIVQRYGPGPRIHYHTGMIDAPLPQNTSVGELRKQLVASQERILRYAAETWSAAATLTGDVLDVGCGLGGGAIFWAEEFGARVTAVTCVASHVNLVTHYAGMAGVASRVQPMVCDASEVPGKNRFDAVVAVDSSGYLPRARWFRRLASLLRPGGRVFVIDCFLGHAEYAEPFNRHWRTRIGSVSEYLAAARAADLRVESVDDISRRTEHFWTTTLALIGAEQRDVNTSPDRIAGHDASARAHALVRQGLADGSLSYALMSFSKSAASA